MLGWLERDRTSFFFFCKNELLEGKGPSESLRGGVVSEPGRRRGSCGRKTRDRGAWFPLGTPPGLQAPPLPKMYPSRPPPHKPSCPRSARGRRPRPPSPSAPLRGRLPTPTARASRRTRERETRPPARGARRRPLPSWPLPSPTPTAPAPHPRDPPGAARPPPGYTTRPATGGGAAAGRGRRRPRSAGNEVTPGGIPSHPARQRRAPLDTLPPPLFSGPESVTGIGFQHGGQEAAPRGGENIPAAPALGGAGPGRRPREEPRGQTARCGARKGRLGVEMTRETRGPNRPPRRGTPRPQVGLGWRVRKDTSSTLPPYPLIAVCKRVSRRHPSRNSLGLPELHPKDFPGGARFTPNSGSPN